jgi:hypothetical protein
MKNKFLHKFNYIPEAPFDVVMGEEESSKEYCKILQKCIDDNFDYTIELYGTKADGHSWEKPEFYID